MEAIGETNRTNLRYTPDDAEGILFPADTTKAFGVDTQADLHREVKRIRKKIIDLELHGQTLSEYYRLKHIPRGFRISNQPTIGRNKQDFCQKWCDLATQCSLSFILLVIEEVKVQLCETKRELSTLEANLRDKYTNPESFSRDQDKLNNELTLYTDNKRHDKRDKLRLVTLDYKEGRVYPWLHGSYTSRPQRFPRKNFQRGKPRPRGPSSKQDPLTENPSSESDPGPTDDIPVPQSTLQRGPLESDPDTDDPGGERKRITRTTQGRANYNKGRPPRSVR